MTSTETLSSERWLRAGVLVFLAALLAIPVAADDEPGYGFYRTVEGQVRLTTLDREEPIDIEPNYPLLLGDRIWLGSTGRLEALLPDQTVVRAAGETDLYFETLAGYSEETGAEASVLRLLEGEIQIVYKTYGESPAPLRIDTANSTIYLQEAGTYRIYADAERWTELVVREGLGEVVLTEGSILVRTNEEAVIDGYENARAKVYPAGAEDALEAWAGELETEAYLAAQEPYVEEEFRYQAAPLRQHGEWIHDRGGYLWRPYATAGWRPYTRGHWVHTPGGYYWVSSEPWGAHTAHYGSWSHHYRHGWVWSPGRVFSPAWVHWYWGPSHVAWVPSGYYGGYYGSHGSINVHLGFGAYGWAGGSWDYYHHWTFSPARYFGWRSYRSHWRSGAELARHSHGGVPRGLITHDSRGVPRGFIGRPEELVETLRRKPNNSSVIQRALPDVTDFVARKPNLDRSVREAVFAKPGSSRSPLRQGRPVATVRQVDPPRASIRLPERSSSPDRSPTADTRSRLPERSVISARPTPSQRALPPRPDRTREDVAKTPVRIAQPSERVSSRTPASVIPPRGRSLPSSPTVRTQERLSIPAPARPSTRTSVPDREVRPPTAQMPRSPNVTSRTPVVRRVLDGVRGRSDSRPPTVSSPRPTLPARPSVATPPGRTTAPMPSRTTAPMPSRTTAPTPSRSTAPMPSRTTAPAPSRPTTSSQPPSRSSSSSRPPSGSSRSPSVSSRPTSKPPSSMNRPSPSSSSRSKATRKQSSKSKRKD